MKKLLLFSLLALWGAAASAAVKLPALFSDHALLARRAAVPVWGKADPGEKVTVTLGKKSASTSAGQDGKWMVKLDLYDSPDGPLELKVNDKVVKDVLVGEVWLCSGQSNMQFRLARALGAKEAIARTDNKLRAFFVPSKAAKEPLEEIDGKWVISSPRYSGGFYAVAYFFGRKLREELNCPVGLIHAAIGGTPVSSWISKEAMAEVPEEVVRQKEVVIKRYNEYPAQLKTCLAKIADWEKRYDRADTAEHKLPGADAKWENVPSVRQYSGKPGAVWFRHHFTLKQLPGKSLAVSTGRQSCAMECYVNGTLVGRHSFEKAVQQLSFAPAIPEKLLKKGENELLFRVFSSSGRPWLNDTIRAGEFLLDNKKWEVSRERELSAVNTAMRKEYPALPGQAPSFMRVGNTLYNGMISPLRPYGLSGMLWYQGEADNGRPELYRKLFPALIRSWRKDFGDPEDPDLPFYYCQLPGFKSKQTDPPQGLSWAEIRDAQDSALALPHTGSAVLIDLGEANDIHPLEKTIPGNRLAALALTQVYGKKGIAQGPRFASCRQENGKIRIQFSQTGSGLEARPLPDKYPLTLARKKYAKLTPHVPGSPVQGFAVCGKDGKWVWSKAEIDGNEVVLTPVVAAVKVRYAWENNPTCNLFNRDGFPAAPFQCEVK